MTTAADSTIIHPVAAAATAGLEELRDGARRLARRIEELAERKDVARHPVLVRAMRNVAGLPDRPPHEIAVGAVTLAIMIATDSIVVDIAANVVAVLFVNHPHPVDGASAGDPAPSPVPPAATDTRSPVPATTGALRN